MLRHCQPTTFCIYYLIHQIDEADAMSSLVENLMIGKYADTHRYKEWPKTFVIQFDFKSKELRNPDKKKSSYVYLKVRLDHEYKHAS